MHCERELECTTGLQLGEVGFQIRLLAFLIPKKKDPKYRQKTVLTSCEEERVGMSRILLSNVRVAGLRELQLYML